MVSYQREFMMYLETEFKINGFQEGATDTEKVLRTLNAIHKHLTGHGQEIEGIVFFQQCTPILSVIQNISYLFVLHCFTSYQVVLRTLKKCDKMILGLSKHVSRKRFTALKLNISELLLCYILVISDQKCFTNTCFNS